MVSAALLLDRWRARLPPLLREQLGQVAGALNDPTGQSHLGTLDEAQIGLRPVHIYDLPDELLLGVFRYLLNRDDIKSLRLSSKRLNETSSHLLINTLRVSPNSKSLERLDQVSRHPNISRGVCRLIVSVDVYSPELARDVQGFTTYCLRELAEFINLPRAHVITRAAEEIHRSWRCFLESFQDPYNGTAHLNDDHISALHNGWLRYKDLYDQQQMVLLNWRFSDGIASAISRMAFLNDLVITDRSRSTADEDLWSPSLCHKMSTLVQHPTRLVEEMMIHTFSWRKAAEKSVQHPPTYLLHLILLAIHNAGSSLAHLRFDLTPPQYLGLKLDHFEWTQLRSFARSLKSCRLAIGAERSTSVQRIRSREEIRNFEKFLAVLTRSSKLDTLALDFAFRERHCHRINRTNDPRRTSIGPLMVDWQKHHNIHLKNCSITLKELCTFINLPRKEPAVFGLWYVYLLDGTWAEAVEILRREVLRGNLSRDSYVRWPYGAECLTMAMDERKRIFHYRSNRCFHKDSLVNCYIKGYDVGAAINPLR
ncbi:hypothetical protein KVR01_001797 [Diaporthe batatas]|uniref:uncharacterized protein n=1 Tax=Diaporthe batatas TaxID=748121 RepID=UPI001D037C53|nr:uncharacterized protein KVR01_001797 [Diaporthe batatas]KAG8169048.1 hypothetical protein KVR01_001797 [Diaporthe batatas]